MFFEEGIGTSPGAFWMGACSWHVIDKVESYEIFFELAGEDGLAGTERAFPSP